MKKNKMKKNKINQTDVMFEIKVLDSINNNYERKLEKWYIQNIKELDKWYRLVKRRHG